MVLPNPVEGPVVAEAARRWVLGEMDTKSYFSQAREAATGRARIEVTLRLQANSRNRPAGPWRTAANGFRWARRRRLR